VWRISRPGGGSACGADPVSILLGHVIRPAGSESRQCSRENDMAFQPLCKSSLLHEGELVPCIVDGTEVVVMWPEGGRPRAFDAACPHDDVSLTRGVFSGRTLTCIAHGWVFDGQTGEGVAPEGCAMQEYPIRLADGVIEIDLEDED
jgi:toluene monooxygenase system ferredoxin subunit